MKRVTSEEMRRIDQRATQDLGIPSLLLMENAGRSISEIVFRDFKPCKVLVFVGKGNNGGDGFVVARHLTNRGFSVKVILLEDPSRLKPDPLLNFNIVIKMKIPLVVMIAASEDEFLKHLQKTDLVVDAIFGVGLNCPVDGTIESAILAMNQSRKPVISVDVPSGLEADTGEVLGVAVKAAKTVTLGLPKRGLFEDEGPRHAGEIEVVDLGLPLELLQPFLD